MNEVENQKYGIYARFLNGELDDDEKQAFLENLEKNPLEKEIIRKLESVWNDYSPKVDSVNRVWKLTASKLGLNETKVRTTFVINNYLRYAAIAILVLSLSFNLYFFADNWMKSPVDFVEYTTKAGEVKDFELADGSHVWLNSGSTLLLPKQFNSKKRNAFLIGQAFFQVKKDAKNPFLVNTSDVTVKVIGTTFDLQNYSNDKEIVTSLINGKVEIINKVKNGENVELKPSEVAVFNKADGSIIVNSKSKYQIASWREGHFRFYKSTFLEISHQLERKFKCEFVFVDESAERLMFTADFENEGPDEILTLLSKTHSFKFWKSGKKFIISSSK